MPNRPTTTAILALALLACDPDGEPQRAPPEPSISATSPALDSAAIARADRSRVLGDSTAPLWIVIVSDFQCPYCKTWHDATYPALRREFVDPGRVRLAYLHVPLSRHQHAQTTAELAMCAGARGRVWGMDDALFDSQGQWFSEPRGTAYFDRLLAPAGLDSAAARQCLDRRLMEGIVRADYDRATARGVVSTPSFFVGDTLIVGAQPIDSFRVAIATEIRKRRSTPAARR